MSMQHVAPALSTPVRVDLVLVGLFSLACSRWPVLVGLFSLACSRWPVLVGLFSLACPTIAPGRRRGCAHADGLSKRVGPASCQRHLPSLPTTPPLLGLRPSAGLTRKVAPPHRAAPAPLCGPVKCAPLLCAAVPRAALCGNDNACPQPAPNRVPPFVVRANRDSTNALDADVPRS